MPGTVKIRNLLKRSRTFNLEHPDFVNSTKRTAAGMPESIDFLPLETKELPASAVECREIKSALTRHPKRRPTLRVLS